MKKAAVLSVFVLLLVNAGLAQDRQKYSELVNEAYELYENKAYLSSAKKYSEAFVAFGNRGMVSDRYNAACAWALAGESDSAFVQLRSIAKNAGYADLEHIVSDADLTSLHKDQRWSEVVEIIRSNKEKSEAKYDKVLVAILDTVYAEDQAYRQQMDDVLKKYGYDSEEMKSIKQVIKEKDSVNLVKVKRILDEKGWLGPDVIGEKGNMTLFLVIQHADHKTQEAYLPMMRNAVAKGNAQAGSLALLEDRVALGQGRKQLYGSQIGRNEVTGRYYVLPLEDPDNVDKRRAEVGLGKLSEYVKNWGLEWDPGKYKKEVEEEKAKKKEEENQKLEDFLR